MKKRISISLVIVMLITMVMPVISMASQDDQLQTAIKRTKSLLGIGEEYEQFDYSISKNQGTTIYDLRWLNADETSHIEASINSEGEILSYDKYSNNDSYENRIPSITEEDGLNIAKDFIKKINPQISDNIKYTGNKYEMGIYTTDYYFRYVRTEKNIPFENNTVNVNVDNITGEVKSFRLNWDKDIKFPSDDGIISQSEAEKSYKEKVNLELMYKYNYDGKDMKPKLVYSVRDKNKSIDAKTGEVLDYSNEYYGVDDFRYKESLMFDNMKSSQDEIQLTKEEIEAIKKSQKIMSESEAESIARNFANISNDIELNYLRLDRDKSSDEYVWNLHFSKEEKDNYSFGYVLLDGKTKDVLSFNKYRGNNSNEKIKYSKDQALKIATEYLNKVQKEKSAQVEYTDIPSLNEIALEEEEPSEYYFSFTRSVDGVLFEGDGFYIRVDSRTGEILGYSQSWYKGEIPLKDNVVSKEQAYDTFLKEGKLELQYITPLEDADNKKKETKLAYVLSNKDKLDIDANTGKPINLGGYIEDIEEAPEYTDIENSIAKEQIEMLSKLKIYLPGEKFEPKEKITQKDFLYLLAKSKSNYVKYEDTEELYKTLSRENIVRKGEKSPDSTITREEAIKFIIRSLKYDKIADIQGIYNINFKDADSIDPKLKGYIAIATGLDIVKGASGGNFNPKAELTREQGAIMIYNVLNSK